jgi:hypothetical protein
VARLHGEAFTLVAAVGAALNDGRGLDQACLDTVARLRFLIDEANAIANGEIPAERSDGEEQGEVSSQAVIDALFGIGRR